MSFEMTNPGSGKATGPSASMGRMVPLPGESAVRLDLVDSAVRDINRIYVGKGLEAARGIGEYVLKTFFDGKTRNFQRRGRKHVSFRRLAERGDLRVSHMFIWNCVAFVDQLKLLPSDIAKALPVTHHTLLLPVHDEKTKVLLARKAVRENLTKRELAVEVRRVREQKTNGGARRGRPPTPAVVRVLALLARVAAQAQPDVAKVDLDHLDGRRVRALLSDAESHLAAIHALVERLRGQLYDAPSEIVGSALLGEPRGGPFGTGVRDRE